MDGTTIEVIDDDDDFDPEEFDTSQSVPNKDRQKTWQSLSALQQVIDSLPAGRDILDQTPLPRPMPRANSLSRSSVSGMAPVGNLPAMNGMPQMNGIPSFTVPSMNGHGSRATWPGESIGLNGPGKIQFPDGRNPILGERHSPLPFDFDFSQPPNNQLATAQQNPHRMLSMIKNTLGRGGPVPGANANGPPVAYEHFDPLTLSPAPQVGTSVEFMDDPESISLPPSAYSAPAYTYDSSPVSPIGNLSNLSVPAYPAYPAYPTYPTAYPTPHISVPYSAPMQNNGTNSSFASAWVSPPPTLQPLCTTGTSPATIYEVNSAAPEADPYLGSNLPSLPDWSEHEFS